MPSGPKKRKAAKRKMESLGLIRRNNGDSTSVTPTTLLSPGNGSESGGEAMSPTTLGGGRFEGEAVESDRSSAAMEGSDSGSEKLAGDGAVIPQVVVPDSSSSDAAVVPVSKTEDVVVEQVKTKEPDMGAERLETEGGLEIGNSGVDPSEVAVAREGDQATPVSVSELTDVVEQPLTTSLEKAVAETGQFGDVPVEKEEKSTSVESPSNAKEEKVGSSSDTSAAQASDGGEQQLHAESQEIRNEVAAPPHTGHRSFWVNCCGLLDLLTGAHR